MLIGWSRISPRQAHLTSGAYKYRKGTGRDPGMDHAALQAPVVGGGL